MLGRCTVATEEVIHRHCATKRRGYRSEWTHTQIFQHRDFVSQPRYITAPEVQSQLVATGHVRVARVCALSRTLNAAVAHLSAALNMPLAACDLRSGGQEERKRSSSFIMERMLDAETSAKERSKARLERAGQRQLTFAIPQTSTFKNKTVSGSDLTETGTNKTCQMLKLKKISLLPKMSSF